MVEPALYVYPNVSLIPVTQISFAAIEYDSSLAFVLHSLTLPGRALDFLYMDYKPPRPLEILISSDILSKYQRMFTFILRLLRGKIHNVSFGKNLLSKSRKQLRAPSNLSFECLRVDRLRISYFRR